MSLIAKPPVCLHTTLSKQEKTVVSLMADGLSSKQIADKLRISQRTVENHRKNMLRKTGTKSSAELVAVAIRNKLIAWYQTAQMDNGMWKVAS